MSNVFPKQKPFLRAVFLLRCPRCARYPLRRPRTWFQFNVGCQNCGYRYERESGYFWGAAWMINYPLVGIIAMISVAFMLQTNLKIRGLRLAAVVSLIVAVAALLLYPFARALWMYLDQRIHPLNAEDSWHPKDP